MKSKAIIILFVFLGCIQQVTIDSYLIMGDLPIGEYAVGFKTIFNYDLAKKAVPFSDWDGNLSQDN